MDVGHGMPRLRAPGRIAWTAASILAACTPEPEPEPETFAVDSDGEDVVAPTFIDPASGMLAVDSTRETDVRLQVADIDRARTELLLDGAAVGDLRSNSVLGTLGDTELSLRLRGALVPASHRLVLQTATELQTISSEEVVLVVRPAAAPLIDAEVGDARIPGRVVTGFGAEILAALDDTDAAAPTLTVVRRAGETWDWSDAKRVALPGYVAGPTERGIAVGVQVTVDAQGEPERLRVAWRDGNPGRAVMLLDTPWASADESAIGLRALELTPGITGPVEYAEVQRPHIVGDRVFTEIIAATDVEMPRPGDRAVLVSRIRAAPAQPAPPQRLSVGGSVVDIDQLGPAFDLARNEVGGSPLLSARLDQRRAVVLEIDDGLISARPTRGDLDNRTFVFTETPLVTVVGGLGSRLVASAALDSGGRLRLLRNSDRNADEAEEITLSDANLPSLDRLTADPTAAVIGGAAVVLLSYGDAAAVQAVFASDTTAEVVPLPALQCDSVAVPAGASNAVLPLACVQAGMVHDATLRVVDGG